MPARGAVARDCPSTATPSYRSAAILPTDYKLGVEQSI